MDIRLSLPILVLALAAGCSEQPSKETIGTGAGAAVGGILGHEIGGGTTGTVVGGVIGALLGREVGRRMDVQDEQKAQTALEQNRTVSWQNPDSNTQYTVQPTNTFQGENDRTCRNYTTSILVNGERQTATGTACRRSDGTWEVVK